MLPSIRRIYQNRCGCLWYFFRISHLILYSLPDRLSRSSSIKIGYKTTNIAIIFKDCSRFVRESTSTRSHLQPIRSQNDVIDREFDQWTRIVSGSNDPGPSKGGQYDWRTLTWYSGSFTERYTQKSYMSLGWPC